MNIIKINNASYNVINSKVKYAQSTYNGYKGYAILVTMDIGKDDFKGYVSFYVDFFLNDDFKNIENKSYIENLNEFDSKVSMLEILAESDFTDYVHGKVFLNFGNIINKQINMDLRIDSKELKLDYHGLLDLN